MTTAIAAVTSAGTRLRGYGAGNRMKIDPIRGRNPPPSPDLMAYFIQGKYKRASATAVLAAAAEVVLIGLTRSRRLPAGSRVVRGPDGMKPERSL